MAQKRKKPTKAALVKKMKALGLESTISHRTNISLEGGSRSGPVRGVHIDTVIQILQGIREKFPKVKNIRMSYDYNLYVSLTHDLTVKEMEAAIKEAEKKEAKENKKKAKALKNQMEAYEERFKNRRPF